MSKILNKTARQVRRIAEIERWESRKETKGAITVLYFSAKDVEKYLKRAGLVKIETKALKKIGEHEEKTKKLEELPHWNKQIALARFYLCLQLEKKYQELEEVDKKSKILSDFISEAKEKYKDKIEKVQGISESTLKRWYKVYLKNRDNPGALASKHGKNKGKRNLTQKQKEMALELYGDKNKPTMMKVYEQMLFAGEKISYHTLRNYLKKDVDRIVINKLRQGKKEFKDTYVPFAIRNYLEKPNYVWMSDGHDLDLMCKTREGEIKTAKLIVWQDHASRLWTGWSLSFKESVEPIVEALKNGIEKWGIPDGVYTDNGRAYKSKELIGNEEIVGIYATLGIEQVTHALPYNAQAKAIERSFRDFKETFAKSFLTYKGGNITERPERLKEVLKNPEYVVEYDDLIELIEQYVEYRNHQYYKIRGGHRGEGMNGRTPLERFEEECPLSDRKIIDKEKLRLLCMYKEQRKVQQSGISLKNQVYLSQELLYHVGEKVEVRYDYRDLTKIYVYRQSGEYICEAELINKIAFKSTVEEIKQLNSLKKQQRKAIKAAIDTTIKIREQDNTSKILDLRDMKRLKEKRIENEEKKQEIYLWE